MQTAIVAAIGGSLLSRDSAEELTVWKQVLSSCLAVNSQAGIRTAIVVGGGRLARDQISARRAQGVDDEVELDLVGIEATRTNAAELKSMLEQNGLDVPTAIPETIDEAIELLQLHSVIVMGGTSPGHTTDAVAIMLGVACKANRVLIATNVSHVFTADPRKDPDATPIESMTLTELNAMAPSGSRLQAGSSSAVDPVGVRIALEAGLSLAVLDGRVGELLGKALTGQPFTGTSIEPVGV